MKVVKNRQVDPIALNVHRQSLLTTALKFVALLAIAMAILIAVWLR